MEARQTGTADQQFMALAEGYAGLDPAYVEHSAVRRTQILRDMQQLATAQHFRRLEQFADGQEPQFVRGSE